jgi:3-(3-hydroxy-phenyl)propionate hydroxylase
VGQVIGKIEINESETKMKTNHPVSVPDSTDVLIVGYGPVGAAVAALLGRYGVKTLVIDKLCDVLLMPRAIALDNEALRILQMIGLAEDAFAKIVIPEVKMHCPYVGEFGRVNASGTIDGHPKLVTFYQPDLEHALRKQVGKFAHVNVLGGFELMGFEQDEEYVFVTIKGGQGDTFTVRSRYLVGADGASSKVRTLIGQDFQGQTYAEDWLIVDANKREGKSIDHIEFICDPRRPTPHMPAPGGRERWEFMLQPGESRENMEHPDTIAKLLAPWVDAKDLSIERHAVYRFHARCCERFQQGRVFLVGDAAHITPPFVGQGLVAGLRDAANIAWKLAWVTRGHAPANILDSYDQERRPHAKKMIELAKFMGHMVMPKSALFAMTVHGMMKSIRIIPPAKTFFEELKIKPANRFQHGLFVKGASRAKLIRGGQLPQGEVSGQNEIACLSDDLMGEGFTIVGVGIDPLQVLDESSKDRWVKMGGQFLHLASDRSTQSYQRHSSTAAAGDFIADLPHDWIIISRPDRVIMHEGPADQAVNIVNQCLKMLNG